jgi:hypothetical protein
LQEKAAPMTQKAATTQERVATMQSWTCIDDPDFFIDAGNTCIDE